MISLPKVSTAFAVLAFSLDADLFDLFHRQGDHISRWRDVPLGSGPGGHAFLSDFGYRFGLCFGGCQPGKDGYCCRQKVGRCPLGHFLKDQEAQQQSQTVLPKKNAILFCHLFTAHPSSRFAQVGHGRPSACRILNISRTYSIVSLLALPSTSGRVRSMVFQQ